LAQLQPVKIRNITLGTGRPKIAVPITGITEQEIIAQAQTIKQAHPDLIEWRLDYFEEVTDSNSVQTIGQALRQVLGDMALLTTFRTHNEGGQLMLNNSQEYQQICQNVLANNFTDTLDIQLYQEQAIVQALVEQAHQSQTVVIMSNHDFEKTPTAAEIQQRLLAMIALGADVAKMAVMPQSVEDVITLITATQKTGAIAEKPLITMAMGDLGKVSRIAGEVFGSVLTFASVGAASAPGQIPIANLRQELEDLRIKE
jgi:3-dehydroquinate dehydratase I